MLPDDLVSPAWLNEHLETVRVIDIRGYVRSEDLGAGRQRAAYTGAREEFDARHIPGAVYVDWTVDIVDPQGDVAAQIAHPAEFARAMEAIGIGDQTPVVVADHAGGHFATRMWWALRYYGHDDVAVLDGGYRAWTSAGLPLTQEAARVPEATFTPRVRQSWRSDSDDVLHTIRSGERQLIDARDSAQFTGATQRGSRGGHIPGAVSFPIANLFEPDGRWKQPEQIRALAVDAGIDLDRGITAYCNGGVTATAALYALQRSGAADISNYDGSWNEWGEREDLPVDDNRDLFGKDA